MRPVRWMVLAAVGFGLAAAAAQAADEAALDTKPDAKKKLRVAAMPLVAVLDWDGPQPKGVVIDVWDEVAGRLGVTTEFVRVRNVAELLGSVADGGTVDVALGPVAIVESRERLADLTHAISHSGLRIAVRQRTGTGFTGALASLLSWRLAQFVAAVLALAWMIGGIVLLASFTSVLTAEMTVERVSGSIQGPRDLAGRTVGCQEGFVGGDSVRERGGTVQEFANLPEAIDALAMGMVEAVVAENHQLMHVVTRRPRADIRIVGPIFDSFDYGFAVPTGSPLREPINTVILQMREDGVLERIMTQWLGRHD